MTKIKTNTLASIKFLFINLIFISFNYAATCDASSGWCYDQSSHQCFYNFNDAQFYEDNQMQNLDPGTFDGNSCPNNEDGSPGNCDIIGAFMVNEDGEEICIGWTYQLFEVFNIYQVTVMGHFDSGQCTNIFINNEEDCIADGSIWNADIINGLNDGEIPNFKIWDASELTSYDAIALNKEEFTDTNGDGCWTDGEEYEDENGNGQWDPSIIPGFENNGIYSIKQLKGLAESTDCNGEPVPDSDTECQTDPTNAGCATFDDCDVCSNGLTCIEPTVINDDDDCSGPYVDCECVCFGGSYIGDCGACLSEDKESDYNIDCNGDCHPATPDSECTVDDIDCGLRDFDDLYFEYDIELDGCCNPIYWTTWYDDADMDMLGDPDLEYDLCLPELIAMPIAQNNYDQHPSCFSNSVDECGVCDGFNLDMDCTYDPDNPETWEDACFGDASEDLCGECDADSENDNLTCTGCTDSDAANYDPEALFYDGSCFFEVWPGDTDVSGVVGPGDIIPIGIFWGEMGSSRTIDSGNDYTWQSQFGYDNWNNKMALFADANGDGIVDIFDILVVLINWGNVVESDSYNTNLSSYYSEIDLELYRENFEEIYYSIPDGYDNNPIQLYLEDIFGFESIVQLPQDYKLHQNRPNPFNPTTNIVYEIPKEGNIQIIITNVLGEVVNQYGSYVESPGIYNYEFDASALPSGVYIYHLKTSSGMHFTNKMMLIK